MTDARRELRLLRASAADLEAYLKSDAGQWSLAGAYRDHFPQLSLGTVLVTQAKLGALARALEPAAQTELAEARREVAGIRARWRANWARRAEKEIDTRLNTWARALRELNAADYPAAAQSRLMLGLLLEDAAGDEAPGLERQRARLATLDSLARARLKPDGFALDDDLQAAFPRETYWYLYGRPEAA